MKKLFVVLALLLVAKTAYAQEQYAELLMSDIKTEKVAVITEAMGGDVRLMFGQWGSYRPLIRFNLAPGAIPSAATVVSAELGIFCYGRNLFQDMEIEVYQVVRPWNRLQATWYRAKSGDNWDIEGCDHPGCGKGG